MSRTLPLALGLTLLSLNACTTQQPLSSVDRARYHTIALDPRIKTPEHYVYRDITGQRARNIGANGGLVGLLIGGAIGANSEGAGFARFDAAASKRPVNIADLVRGKVEQALQTSKMFALVSGNAEATLRIEILVYGVAPTNGRELGGVICAQAELVSRDGKSLWKKTESGVSATVAPLET